MFLTRKTLERLHYPRAIIALAGRRATWWRNYYYQAEQAPE